MISRNLLFAVAFAAASTVAGYRTYVINPPINNNPILEDEKLYWRKVERAYKLYMTNDK